MQGLKKIYAWAQMKVPLSSYSLKLSKPVWYDLVGNSKDKVSHGAVEIWLVSFAEQTNLSQLKNFGPIRESRLGCM